MLPTRLRWPSSAVLVGVLLIVAVTAFALLVHADALQTPGAGVLPFVLGLAVVGYALAGIWLARRPAAGDVLAGWLGVAAGLMWCAEIAGGGPILLSRSAEQVNGAAFSIAALVTTLASGVVGGLRHGPNGALRGGALAGLLSGEVVLLLAVPMTMLFLARLGRRADYQAQFLSSRAPSMPAFLVQDALAGYGAHLFINPVLGAVGAGVGALVGLAARHARPKIGVGKT